MEKILNFLFSMKMMTIGMGIFLVSIAVATFIESSYGVQAAKIIVYNAIWFEILLVFLAVNLIANIFTYRMYKREKISMFLFHVSFLIILLGSGITRHFSFEGMMKIQEGENSNILFSSDPHLIFKVSDPIAKKTSKIEQKMYMSEITDNYFQFDITSPDSKKQISIEYVNFGSNMKDSLVSDPSIKESSIIFVIGGQDAPLVEGQARMLSGIPLGYGVNTDGRGIQISRQGRKLLMRNFIPISYLNMSELRAEDRMDPSRLDSLRVDLPLDTVVPLEAGKLYSAQGRDFVFKELKMNTKMKAIHAKIDGEGVDIVTVKVSDGKRDTVVELRGGMGSLPNPNTFQFNGLLYDLTYGPKTIELPFYVGCKDFRLKSYAGTGLPSSYESDLVIIDSVKKHNSLHKLFMNNVIDYGGYRFFQSNYFPRVNPTGTILSVNHDWWGTNVTYLGYLMMSIAMIASLFAPNGRLRILNDKLKKIKNRTNLILLIAFSILSGSSFAQEVEHNHQQEQTEKWKPNPKAEHFIISEEHSDKLASLLVLDSINGRKVPYHTVCLNILRKLYRSDHYGDYNAVQVVTSMQLYHEYWMQQPIIHVHAALRDKLGIKESKISWYEMFNDEGTGYKLQDDYYKAHNKAESKRSEYDKQLIKLFDRVSVFVMVRNWKYMMAIPLKKDNGQTWVTPESKLITQADSATIVAFTGYLISLVKVKKTGNYDESDRLLEQMKKLQRSITKEGLPSERLVEMEISYNKMNIFKNSAYLYILLGFFLLVIFVMETLGRKALYLKVLKWIRIGLSVLVFVAFLYHGYGLLVRSYITGHAPWSNGYEALVFIGWVTILAGFLFSRRNKVVLGAAAVLAFLMLFVTQMELLDPQITALQPVLKSYWLKIHVAVITGSYAFLGLGAILGLVNLFLYSARTSKNANWLNTQISEITYISEMTMTIGLFMLTIGTFLGGVWANESWGRYWGWDPKETWALVSILVYAVILHLRFIPLTNGKFLFNLVSFWGYSAILFTFFGVNFILSGLHSYAQGDGISSLPTWVTVTIWSFVGFTAFAIFRNYQFKKSNGPKG